MTALLRLLRLPCYLSAVVVGGGGGGGGGLGYDDSPRGQFFITLIPFEVLNETSDQFKLNICIKNDLLCWDIVIRQRNKFDLSTLYLQLGKNQFPQYALCSPLIFLHVISCWATGAVEQIAKRYNISFLFKKICAKVRVKIIGVSVF